MSRWFGRVDAHHEGVLRAARFRSGADHGDPAAGQVVEQDHPVRQHERWWYGSEETPVPRRMCFRVALRGGGDEHLG